MQANFARSLTTPKVIDEADLLICGSGIAGMSAALEARKADIRQKIVVLTSQPYPTINTPALKQFGASKIGQEHLLSFPPGTHSANDIQIINEEASKLDGITKLVHLRGNRAIKFKRAVVCTGSVAKGLGSCPGADFDGVLTLHRLGDFLDLRRRLPEVNEIVVTGSGYMAAETVIMLLQCRKKVIWLLRKECFQADTLGTHGSKVILQQIERCGAVIKTSTEIVGIIGRIGSVAGVVTSHDELINCQMVIACTGTRPFSEQMGNTILLAPGNKGIAVNERLETSIPDVWAAGDCAAIFDPAIQSHQIRAQWYSAQHQGSFAGAAASSYASLNGYGLHNGANWHATTIHDISILTVGNQKISDPTVQGITHELKDGFKRMFIKDDRLLGYLSIGSAQPDGLAIKKLIDSHVDISAIKNNLFNPKFDIRSYFATVKYDSGKLAALRHSGKLPAVSRELAQILVSAR